MIKKFIDSIKYNFCNINISRLYYKLCNLYTPITINGGLYIAGLDVQYRRSLQRGFQDGADMFCSANWRLCGTCTDNIMLKNESCSLFVKLSLSITYIVCAYGGNTILLLHSDFILLLQIH